MDNKSELDKLLDLMSDREINQLLWRARWILLRQKITHYLALLGLRLGGFIS